jgi:hypothetical protein
MTCLVHFLVQEDHSSKRLRCSCDSYTMLDFFD